MSTSSEVDQAGATLPGRVVSAPPGARGIDSSSGLGNAVLNQLTDVLGFTFTLRYVSREDTEQSGDLSHDEALSILDHGLALMVVQHVEASGWHPDAGKGTRYGRNAAKHAAAVGLPKGVCVFLDLEGVATGTSAQTVIDYANHWSEAVRSAGFAPGVYVGANSGLDAGQLGHLTFEHYWKSFSDVPTPAGRGYQMIQQRVIEVLGLDVDTNTTQNDEKRQAVRWLVK